MVPDGSGVAKAKLDQKIQKRLIPGCVLRVLCDFTDPPKNKYLVIARVSTDTWVYVISSTPNQFIQSNPNLLACQVLIKANQHKFLAHNSYIDCSEPISIKTHEMERQLMKDPTRILGEVSQEVRLGIRNAIQTSAKTTMRMKEILLEAFK